MPDWENLQVARRIKLASITEEPVPSQRLSDLAYERVLEALFERRVQTGSFVSQGELSDIVGIPVAPLRDALRVLEAEGVLAIHPRSGIQFVRPGLELTRSTYQFRSILERAAVRVFAEQGDEAQVAELLQRHAALIHGIGEAGLAPSDLVEIEDLERGLHTAIIGILRNPLVENSHRRMHTYLRLLKLDRKMTAPVALRTLREHVAILEACAARDPDRAEAALDAHFNAALQRSLGMV
jgi:DNA-binding GntR family transcriptional regulator